MRRSLERCEANREPFSFIVTPAIELFRKSNNDRREWQETLLPIFDNCPKKKNGSGDNGVELPSIGFLAIAPLENEQRQKDMIFN